MAETQKFLDSNGIQHLWSKISMQDYPNNETLMAIINAIDETKADKKDIYHNALIENYILPIGEFDIYGCFPSFQIGSKYCVIFDNVVYDNLIGRYWEDEYHGIGAVWGDYSNYPFGFVNQCDDTMGRYISCYIQDSSVEHTKISAPISTCTVTVNHSSFTGYIVYQTSSGWVSKYASSTTTYTDVIVGSLIFIIADKSLDYSIDSVSLSGEAVAESAIIQDSSSTATYVTINGDCTIKIYGNW